VLIADDPPLLAALEALARDQRLVFFAGLPGTGKSLLIHQLAHLAHARGRRIHLLQWDVARPVFEASEAGRRYPLDRGVTHGVVRLAVGRWARGAVARWYARHRSPEHLLIGETPFIGHRLIDLARPAADEAEPVLISATTTFVIPVPSRSLREHMEAERERRARAPLHPREREDAPPEVLQALWHDLAGAAVPYDPIIYQQAYERLLRHRRAEALPLHARLQTHGMSAYDFAVEAVELVPAPDEADRAVREIEAAYPGPDHVRLAIDGWRQPG
jgi:hypothetical protein